MIDLDEFQRRVDAYFQCGQRNEPQGRIILDMMRAMRAIAEYERGLKDAAAELRAENEGLREKLRTIGKLNADNLADIDAMMERKQ
jgi:hypothetical protein